MGLVQYLYSIHNINEHVYAVCEIDSLGLLRLSIHKTMGYCSRKSTMCDVPGSPLVKKANQMCGSFLLKFLYLGGYLVCLLSNV